MFLHQQGFSSLTHPDWEKVELAFPREKLGILIGPKGHTIKSIQGMDINNKDFMSDHIISHVHNEALINTRLDVATVFY